MQAQNEFHRIQRVVLQTYLEYNISSWRKCDFQQRNGSLRWSLSKIQWPASSEEFGPWAVLSVSSVWESAIDLCTCEKLPPDSEREAICCQVQGRASWELSTLYAWSGWSLAFVSASSLQSFASVIRTVLIKTCTGDPLCSLKKLDLMGPILLHAVKWPHSRRQGTKTKSDLYHSNYSKQIKAFIVWLWSGTWKTTVIVLANAQIAQTTY